MRRAATGVALLVLLGCGSPASPPATPAGEASGSPTGAAAAATDTSAPVSAKAPSFDPSVEASVAKVKALIADPDEAAISAAFTPAFLEKIPVGDLVEFFDRVLDGAGPCTTHAVREVITPTKVAFRFECDESPRNVTIGIESEAPHRMNYLLIKPAD